MAISKTMVLFNSAVNPFVYAPSSHNLKEKVKGLMYTTTRPTSEGTCTALQLPLDFFKSSLGLLSLEIASFKVNLHLLRSD